MRWMTALLFFLLSLVPFLPSAAAAKQGESVFFIASDLHYISPSLTDHGAYFTNLVAAGDGKLVMYIDEITDAFAAEVIAAQPDALILSGDLTFNGARKSHEDLAGKLRRIDQSGVPVFVLPGNHDLHCYAAARFEGDSYTREESVTSEAFAAIYHDLGFDLALSRDPYSLSYIAEPVPGVRLLMLDTNVRNLECIVHQNTFLWLENELAKAKADGAKVIAVSHQNLYAHSDLLFRGYVLSNADMLRAVYARHGVSVNLSGHLHIQHIISKEGLIPEIAVSSLAVSPCQYGVLSIGQNQAQFTMRAADVGAWAQSAGKSDANLLNFREYAAAFFAVTAVRQALPQLSGDPDPSSMATWLANLNAAYFCGRMDTLDASSEYAVRWQESDTFFGQYVRSILSEERRDHTRLVFPL